MKQPEYTRERVAPQIERRRWVRFVLGSTITRYEHELDCARETIAEAQLLNRQYEKHIAELVERLDRRATEWEIVAWMALASAGDSAKSLSGDLNGRDIDMRWIGGYPGPYRAVPSKYWPKDSND